MTIRVDKPKIRARGRHGRALGTLAQLRADKRRLEADVVHVGRQFVRASSRARRAEELLARVTTSAALSGELAKLSPSHGVN